MTRTRPYAEVTNLNAYSTGAKTQVRCAIKADDGELSIDSIEMPSAIAYRMYYLGRAYDFQPLKLMRPEGAVVVQTISLQGLIDCLDRIGTLVTDPVVHHFLSELVPFLKKERHNKNATYSFLSEN